MKQNAKLSARYPGKADYRWNKSNKITTNNGDGQITQFWSEEESSLNLIRSDMTPSEKITDEAENGLVNCFGASEFDSPNSTFEEAEILVNFLRKARSEAFNSPRAAPKYRKLMDEMLNIALEELNTVPEDRDWIDAIVSARNRIICLNRVIFVCLLSWMIVASVEIFLTSDNDFSFSGPLPT